MRGLGALLAAAAIALLMRSTALPALAARGVVLDVLAFVVAAWALRHGETAGTLFGFALGLAADLDAAHWLGRHALALSLLGYAVGRVSGTLVREQSRTHFTLLVLCTALHQAWALAFEIGAPGSWAYAAQRIGLAVAATAPAGTLVLALVRRVSGRPLFAHARLAPAP
uniref:Rod shape-determining protein MreD n=1 Tax=Eiseniibacteriota bacterium TaxID=2212470 RepID=A0A832I150_UNCEI